MGGKRDDKGFRYLLILHCVLSAHVQSHIYVETTRKLSSSIVPTTYPACTLQKANQQLFLPRCFQDSSDLRLPLWDLYQKEEDLALQHHVRPHGHRREICRDCKDFWICPHGNLIQPCESGGSAILMDCSTSNRHATRQSLRWTYVVLMSSTASEDRMPMLFNKGSRRRTRACAVIGGKGHAFEIPRR